MSKKFTIEKGDTNEILREVSTPVALNELHKYKPLAENMLKHIRNPKNGGVGLAIVAHSETTCSDQEGCLSLPGESGDVVRWTEVDIEFYNIEGRKFALHLDQLAARIVQHEIDHLNGILFTDRVGKDSPEL